MRDAVASPPSGPTLAALHRLLRAAVGAELRYFEGYDGEEGATSLGSYPTFLLVQRFLKGASPTLIADAARLSCRSGEARQTLFKLLLEHLSRLNGADGAQSLSLSLVDVLPGAPPLVLHIGRGTRFLKALCGGLLTRLQAGASLESLIDDGTAASAERRHLVNEVSAVAAPPHEAREAREARETLILNAPCGERARNAAKAQGSRNAAREAGRARKAVRRS